MIDSVTRRIELSKETWDVKKNEVRDAIDDYTRLKWNDFFEHFTQELSK